jgi:hypothetical protein
MKKTLLIAAAALAAGVISSQAQVYSANVVGYYNTVVPSHHFALVANQLINGSDASKTNNDINAIFSGLTSDANAVNNSVLYKWNGAGYGIYQYFSGADADAWFGNTGSTSGFYDATGVLVTGSLNQGSGSFLYNPSAAAITNTTVGTVVQSTNSLTIVAGFNIYSLIPPVSTNLESSATFASFPGKSDPNAVNNDVLYKWNGAGYGIYQYFTGADADAWFGNSGSVNGFYDATGVLVSSAPSVGQAFFLYHTGAPVTWTTSFTVQ